MLIAVAIFAVFSTVVAWEYTQAFRETRTANLQNQVFEDGRFVIDRIAYEIRNGTIDYDEYFNQNVVIPSLEDPAIGVPGIDASEIWRRNYGQNFGRYYSAFYNPGSDNRLGFACNDGTRRNARSCLPLRRTIDRNTGMNPFSGKYAASAGPDENAFCANISYNADPERTNPPNLGRCIADSPADNAQIQNELYLISADGMMKTIFAREKIGSAADAYALSILRLKGIDVNGDDVADKFICTDDFQCRGGFDVPGVGAVATDSACFGDSAAHASDLPRIRADELETFAGISGDECDPASIGFARDFIPASPFRVKVTDLRFVISPTEDPRYAFAEEDQLQQPSVTVILTISPNPDYSTTAASFDPVTLVRTVPSGLRTWIRAPILEDPPV